MFRNVVIVVSALLLAAGCGKKDFDEKLNLKLPPIPDGEVNTYRMVTPAGPFGEYATRLVGDWYDEVPIYVLELISKTTTSNVTTTDSSIVLIRQADLRPVTSFRFVKTGSAMVTTAANYGEGSIAVSTWLNTGEEKQRLLPIAPKTYDVDMLTFLGRALKLDPKRPAQVNVVDPMGPPLGGTVRLGEFRVLGDESVTVPAGAFDCRKVGLTVGDRKLELWYEKAGTGRMVSYLDTGSGVTFELLPGEPNRPLAPPAGQP